MFRFCILSILCVYVTASAAFAHPDPGDGYHFGTTRGIKLIVGGENNERFIGQREPDAEGYHIHRYSYTITVDGGSVGLIWEKTFKTGEDPPPPDTLPDGYFPRFGPRKEVTDDLGPEHIVHPPAHSHGVTHEHGTYVSHTHTVWHTHAGDASQHTHTYTESETHSLSDGSHTGVGTRQQNNPPPGSSGREEEEGRSGPPPGDNPPQQQLHSHEVTHQHGTYVSHTHTVTHTGDASQHTHSYTESEIHSLSGGSHTGVGTRQPVQNPPPGNNQGNSQPQQRSHSHEVTHQHGTYVSHTHTVTHTGDASQHTHTYTESEIHSLSGDNHVGVGTRQLTNNLPPGDNQGNSPPPAGGEGGTPEGTSNGATTTTVATPVVGEGGGTPEGTSSPQQVVSSGPQATQPGAPPERQPLLPIRITEYMVRDWTAGIGGLPQWIEVYNPNTEAVNLKGYTFQYATRRSANAPHKVHTLTLAGTQDGFSIAGGGVAILSTRKVPAWRFSGIGASQVYNLSIDNVLKRGWVLTDANGKEIHRLGRAAFSALGDPVAPLHQNKARVSYQVVPSESPPEVYYYGHREDIGSPGFYKQPAPAAPSAVKRKRVGTWASLKQTP